MSIRFKFRSSLNFDTIEIDSGRSSISIGELREKIIRYKKLNVCQDFDLVFSDAVSGQEFDDHSIQIPSGSSVIIKRVPAKTPPPALPSIDAVGSFGMKYPPSPPDDQRYEYEFDGLEADLCYAPEAIIPSFAPEFDNNKCVHSGKTNVAGPRYEGPKLGPNSGNWDVPTGYNLRGNKEKIEEQMKVENLTAPKYTPVEIIGLPAELKCLLCNTYLKEAVMIPCCQHSFCNKCIRQVLVQKAGCPKCSSDKCKVEDLLPNLSLRRTIEHFLASDRVKDIRENDLCKYAPDGESAIQAKDVSCAVTIVQKEPELPLSPCVTGKGSNIVMAEPFQSSFIRRNTSFPASDYRVSNLAAGREIFTPTTQEVEDDDGEMVIIAGEFDLQNFPEGFDLDAQNFPEGFDLNAECQGENSPINLPPIHVLDEASSAGKRKMGLLVETEGGERNFVAAGRSNKVFHSCYMCGSPDHLIRYCPVGSGPHSMLQTGPQMLQGGFPGYASSYWSAAVFPTPRPFPNIYTSPGAMMAFNAAAIPVVRYGAPSYVPSVYGALPSPGGIMRMGPMAPPVVSKAEHLLSHNEVLTPLHCEKARKFPNENLHRGQNRGDKDDFNKHHSCQEPEKALEFKTRKEREASESHSGDCARRSQKHQHVKHIDSDAYSDDARLEKRSRPSVAGKGQKPYFERADSGMQRPDNANRNCEIKYKHHDRSTRKHHEKREQSHSDSSHRHQSDRDEVRRRVESGVRSSHKKRNSNSDSGPKPSSPGDKREQHKDKDAGFESRHHRHATKRTGDDLCGDRWQMVDVSNEDRGGDYYHLKRKRVR